MNFKVNLFFHLYETNITPLGIPILTVTRVSFKTMLVFLFLMEIRGIEDPPSQLNGKFH